MYDNIKLWCFSNDARNVIQCLDDVRETLNKETGEVKESGTHDELIHTKGKYFELYKLQSESLRSVGLD